MIFKRQGRLFIRRGSDGAKILWAVEAASRRLPGMRHCLTKAVVAKLVLNHADYCVNFRIGVNRKGPGKLAAHAWLESDGRVVMGYLQDLDRYVRFPGLGGDAD